jgi:methylmalonyl-CoA mutase N-terminal domain/subunit
MEGWDEYKRWRSEVYDQTRARFPERQAQFKSTSGYEIEPLAGPWEQGAWQKAQGASESRAPSEIASASSPLEPGALSLEPWEMTASAQRVYAQQLGFPGEFPYTRGVQPTMYRGRFWTMRQYAGFGSARATNERYKFLLSKGQKGLSVAFDLPTQMGYDSSDPMALGEVGKVGVAIDTVDDMALLFDGIPQDEVTTSMTINAPAVVLLCMYQLVAERRGIPAAKLGGTIQNDILKEYMARGTYIFPPGPSLMLTADSFRYCTQVLPQWNAISISGYHIREAGCSAVQEIAFTLADGIEYVQRALEAGLDVDSFAGQLSFFFNAHNNFLEEVAKFRAARRLWARVMRDRFKAQHPKSQMLRFHTQTAGSMLTAQQPYNNIVRTALQGLAAVLGGTQSLHTNGFDEALALPTEHSAEIALRTQQIIASESGVTDTIDPLGGAWFIEDLTDKLEAGAAEYIAKIDGMGGMQRAIERGYPQAEIQLQAYEWQLSVERKERTIVGVNAYVNAQESEPELLRDTGEAEKEQRERLEQYLAQRAKNPSQYRSAVRGPRSASPVDGRMEDADGGQRTADGSILDPQPWTTACGRLTDMAAAGATTGYCEAIYSALAAGATEGEIVKALEAVWGRYQPGL